MKEKNLKFYNTKRKITAYALATTTFFTAAIGLSGCDKTNDTPTYTISDIKNDTDSKIKVIVPELGDDITNNTSIMLLLDLITKRDENGKINAELMSKFKSRVDSDNMMEDFNSFLDTIQQKEIEEDVLIRVSQTLPDELNTDKIVLSVVESVLLDLIKYSNANDKEATLREFNRIYSLFADAKSVELEEKAFKISDMSYPARAVANTYGEIALYYSRNYLTEEQTKIMDIVLDDQNNKSYIKTDLEILANQMDEKSEVNVIELFNNKYDAIIKLLDGKVDLQSQTVRNLVNYINIEYLNSDKVSTKDKSEILGEYNDLRINNVLIAIDAINLYNLYHQNAIIPFSALLVNEHLKTDTGKTDKIALDFVQYNSTMLVNTVDSSISYEELRNNPYFENIFKYFTKDNFYHVESDEHDVKVGNGVTWQQISAGANFVNYETILYIINSLPNVKNIDNYREKTQMDLSESIGDIQKAITGECVTFDAKKYVK